MDVHPTQQGIPDPEDQGGSEPPKAVRIAKTAREVLALVGDVAGVAGFVLGLVAWLR